MKLHKKLSCILAMTVLFNCTTVINASVYATENNISNVSQQVTFKIHSQWNGQFIGEILITNTSDSPLNDWELQFEFPYEIVSIWNATTYRENNFYTLEGEDYNRIIYPNQTVSIGFIANYSTSISLPEDYTLRANGTSTPVINNPINNITTPCALQLDIPYETEFSTSKDEVWFSFTPQSSASYEFIGTGNANLCTTLYDENKQNILMNSENTAATNLIGTTLLANKDYYIKIKPLDFNSSSTDFSLTVNKIESPNDPLFSDQWSLLNTSTGIDINILPVWRHLNNNKIQISMADTGVYYEHEDLINNINLSLSYNFTHHINNVFPEDELYGDSYTAVYGHGTHVAGIIGSEINNSLGIAGVVPYADLISLKALGRKLEGATTYTKSIAAFVESVEYATQNDIKIINCSFGGSSPSQAEKDAMLGASDILFVIASGNNGWDLGENPVYPACYYHSNSVVVTNINSDGSINSRANYGGPTDIAAPGTDIISTVPYNKYRFMSGTSMSAPFVSSICGLVWSQNNNLTPEEVKAYVTSSNNVTPLDTLTDKTLSGGLLNAYKAVVCPSLDTGTREVQMLRDPFTEDKKETISYYKEIAPASSKTDEIIVSFSNPVLIDEWIQKLNNLYGFTEISVSGYLESIDAYVLRFSSIEEADIAIDLLNNSNEVTYAEPNYIRE